MTTSGRPTGKSKSEFDDRHHRRRAGLAKCLDQSRNPHPP
jgi:hypothetical protein